MSQPAPEPGLDANFRLAMRRLAATVSIVTCKDGDGRHGITATAIASVCLEPPTVLVCINARTRLYTKIAERHRFCINLLKTCHIELCGNSAAVIWLPAASQPATGRSWMISFT